MRVVRPAAILVLLALAGCAAPRTSLGPVPSPLLSTRAPQPVAPILPAPRPRVETPAPPPSNGLAGATLVVDAGHGGKDPGARGVGPLNEKSINLKIARELGRQLELRGARVVHTRTSDRFVELDARAALADRTRADLFISVHSDASKRSNVSGATVYIARRASAESVRAAQALVAAFRQGGVPCRGVNRADFRVLVGHARPAVLIECGYLTNAAEAYKLSTTTYQSQVATAIAEGVAGYFRR